MPLNISQFGQRVKQKYPEYNDFSDEDLGRRVLERYPEYQDMVDTSLSGYPQTTEGAGKFFRPFMRAFEKELVPFSERTGQAIVPGEYEEQRGEEGLISKLGYGAGFLAGTLPTFAVGGVAAKGLTKIPKVASIISKLAKGGKVAQLTGRAIPKVAQYGTVGALQETEAEPLSVKGVGERAANIGAYTASGIAFDEILAPVFGRAWRKLFPKKEDAQAAVEAVQSGNFTPFDVVKGKSVQTATPIDRGLAEATTKAVIKGKGKLPVSKTLGAQDKYAFNINLDRMKISEEAKANIRKNIDTIRAELESIRGKPMTDQEILKLAEESDMLSGMITREETKQFNASLVKLRQLVAGKAGEKGLTRDFVENLRTLSSHAADWGRRGRALGIDVDPTKGGIKEKITTQLVQLGNSTDDILKAAEGIDWDNPKQVTEFYRKFVKPTFGEIIDEFRYINLLSSPKTHSVNTFTNFMQATVINPGTKLYSGILDSFGVRLNDAERRYYVSEVPVYYRGMANSVGEAFRKFRDVMAGRTFVERPDIARIPTGVFEKGPLSVLNKIPRFLEAQDIFFRTLIAGGEREAIMLNAAKQGLAITSGEVEKEAMKRAAYSIFRETAEEAAKKQGTSRLNPLNLIDKVTNKVYSARGLPTVKWFIPFVRTPMNILKQGIEYSPLGATTAIGAKNATEQVAKSALGTTVFLGAAALAHATDATWEVPQSETRRKEFYAAGRKPYSIKIGDQWISYQRLGPMAYPIALAASIKYFTESDPKRFTSTNLEKLGKIMGTYAQFFTDQSYVQGIGDLLDAVRGQPNALERAFSNPIVQVIPLSALQGFIARIIDPVYRQPGAGGAPFQQKVLEDIMSRLPGLSTQVPPYTDQFGRPSQRERITDIGGVIPYLNPIAPVEMSGVKPAEEFLYQSGERKKATQDILNRINDIIDNEALTPQQKQERLLKLREVINSNLQNAPITPSQ